VTTEEGEPAPEVNGHAEEVEEKEEVESEQVKEKEAESHSSTSADTEVPVRFSAAVRQTTVYTRCSPPLLNGGAQKLVSMIAA